MKLVPLKKGTVFGRLTVLWEKGYSINGKQVRKCRCVCECGEKVTVRKINLRAGTVKSCGCLKKEIIQKRNAENNPGRHGKSRRANLKGCIYGRLRVIEYFGKENGTKFHLWRCRCQCGAIHVTRGASLQSGLTQSCGCLRDDIIRANAAARRQKRQQMQTAD